MQYIIVVNKLIKNDIQNITSDDNIHIIAGNDAMLPAKICAYKTDVTYINEYDLTTALYYIFDILKKSVKDYKLITDDNNLAKILVGKTFPNGSSILDDNSIPKTPEKPEKKIDLVKKPKIDLTKKPKENKVDPSELNKLETDNNIIEQPKKRRKSGSKLSDITNITDKNQLNAIEKSIKMSESPQMLAFQLKLNMAEFGFTANKCDELANTLIPEFENLK